MTSRSRRRRLLFGAGVGVYALLLAVSSSLRSTRSAVTEGGPLDRFVEVPAVEGAGLARQPIRIAYRDTGPAADSPAATVVMLHGSPGRKEDLRRLARILSARARVVTPDLPGFGASTRSLPDYSLRAHAVYVLQLLTELGISRAHVLGFSMGGGVAINLADIAPDRVASLTMLSAIGVQEMELTGDYYVNHAVHGAQLAGLWALREATPHMGLFDDGMLTIAYARNFYDSDQRPLREMLQRVDTPALILHGVDDDLVPVEAALEHHRLMPQSELHVLAGGHFLLFSDATLLGDLVGSFVDRVEEGRAARREDADPERIRAADSARDATPLPRARGIAAAVFAGLLAVAPVVSEIAAGAAAGALVAGRRVDLVLAVGACFTGMCLGHLLLHVGGRRYGRRVLPSKPARWLFDRQSIARSLTLLSRQGVGIRRLCALILGGRRATVVAAGLLRVSAAGFAAALVLANAAWVVTAVGLSAAIASVLFTVPGAASLSPSARVALAVAVAAPALKVIHRAVTSARAADAPAGYACNRPASKGTAARPGSGVRTPKSRRGGV